MTTAISVPFAAAVLLLAAPAAAQVSQADPQAIARSLMDQGYADVRVIEDDGESHTKIVEFLDGLKVL